jgi:hypothetical protein
MQLSMQNMLRYLVLIVMQLWPGDAVVSPKILKNIYVVVVNDKKNVTVTY